MKKFEQTERRSGTLPLILKLDSAGSPVRWLGWRESVILHWNGKVVWSLGEPIKLYGGTSGMTGEQSVFELPTIIACDDQTVSRRKSKPKLTSRELFRRDNFTCAYCGTAYPLYKLTIDHIQPKSRGGKDTWVNTVSACKRDNHKKADRTPHEAGMPLLYVPYTPNAAEHLILQNRRIIHAQLDYLSKMIPEHSTVVRYLNHVDNRSSVV